MRQKQIYVVTGGPGFGKTMLVEALEQLGYSCSGEFARNLIENQLQSGGNILPWKNPKQFQQEILKQRINFFDSIPENSIAFADRGIPDQLAFARYKGFGSPENLRQAALNYRYGRFVFVTPPWKEIYSIDSIRTENFEEAENIHHTILDVYSNLNYEIIVLPLIPVNDRVEFILKTINEQK